MAEPIIKKRKIAFSGFNDKMMVSNRRNESGKREGILALDIDETHGIIAVEYDLWKINFKTIERMIENMGFKLSKKITEKWKRGMAKFTEQNELDNLKATPSSCCEDPRESTNKTHH